MKDSKKARGFATRAIHGGQSPECGDISVLALAMKYLA